MWQRQMSETTTTHYSWRRIVVRSVMVLTLSAVVLGAWMAYCGIRVSIRAEENLHATLFTLRLVDQFVAEQGRWPHSCTELVQVSISNDALSPPKGETTIVRIGGQHGYNWPAASPEIRDHVQIDFHADPDTIVGQTPMDFTAIQPIGPYYEYRQYGFVESLQDTLRSASPAKPDP
jgi:hypothetical protein